MKIILGSVCGIALACCVLQPSVRAQVLAAPDGVGSRYLDEQLPSWVQLSGEERVRLEALGGIGYKPDSTNTYLLQRLRLNLDLVPKTWLKFKFQAEDSRVFFSNVTPSPSTQKDPIDLRIGYVEIGNTESSWVTLRAGRQGFTFGEGRLVADSEWSNVGRAFDGARLSFHYEKFRMDALAGASDKIYTDGIDTPVLGEHFYGLYGSLDKWIPNSTIEPYVFWKLEHNVKGELVKLGNLSESTIGFRWVGTLVGFDYGVETAMQRGSDATEPIATWAIHVNAGHQLWDSSRLPRAFAEFNRASGDNNAKDGVHQTFDPMFIGVHDKFGVADQFSWSNIVDVRTGVQYTVLSKVRITGSYAALWLADQNDGIWSSGKLAIASNGKDGTFIGQEADLQGRYAVRKGSLVDVAFGHIFPGEFLEKSGHGSAYNCLFLGFTQRF